MEAVVSRTVKYNRWLPYWAVLQADVSQVMRGWVYRVWVAVSLLALVGYLLYRLGPYKEMGMIQPASLFVSDLLRWMVLGSITLVVILSVGSISAERGTVADSVLSRGISRYQYYLGKWHARLAVVLITYVVLVTTAFLCSHFLLHEDISLKGSLMAIGTVAALLGTVASVGVAFSAITNSTMMGVCCLWLLLYGGGFALSLFPGHIPSPDRALKSLPYMLRGYYDAAYLRQLIWWSVITSLGMSMIGMSYFSRRDV